MVQETNEKGEVEIVRGAQATFYGKFSLVCLAVIFHVYVYKIVGL